VGRKKSKYEPPIAYDLTSSVKDELHAADCTTGGYAVTLCDTGFEAGAKCAFGRYAMAKCWTGNNPEMPLCWIGEVAGGLCKGGSIPGHGCNAGYTLA